MEDAIAYDFDMYCSFYYTHSVNNNNNDDNNNIKSVYYRVLLRVNW